MFLPTVSREELEQLLVRFEEFQPDPNNGRAGFDGVCYASGFQSHAGPGASNDNIPPLLFEEYFKLMITNVDDEDTSEEVANLGTISFQDFVMEMKTWKTASIEQKLGRIFDMLDIDSQGVLDADVIAGIISC